ncbi:Uncharacterized membrane protein YgaE, UPF0421/DUF939 family [Bacillus sp. OV322]|uniref:aromatic acid exporter family protein n=1 Tax=Bacillus sp. OV322 TaxID=1882764 RepID=UPI0008ECE7A8|nr:aromatic acid exporter family protein [Bacillus sp. OV322]SFC42375.1 Uncharacterized membrane protein YgaE, UPF0421/DUF939 family [Bacillus sp. OV322]
MFKIKIGYRTIKTAVGTALAIILAQLFDLHSFPSAGIITILCIQATKKKSLRASWSRFLACMLAMIFSSFLFDAIAFHPLVIGLILLLFIPATVAFKINEGIVTSSVIILHLYSAGRITLNLLLNETALIAIGIGVALAMNWYMPSVENKMIRYQEEIEENFSRILRQISKYLRTNASDWEGKEITETNRIIAEAKSLAFRDVENHFLREEDIYYHYFKMREKQFDVIQRILPLAANIPAKVKQSGMLADFIKDLGENVHPQNTAIIYLEKLKEMEEDFKQMELPKSREEFESRASLFQLMKEMEEYLMLKHSFKGLPHRRKVRMKKRATA